MDNNRTLLDSLTPIVFRVQDFVLVVLAFYVAYYIRFNHFRISFEYEIFALLTSFTVIASVSLFGGYNSWRGKSRLEMLGRVLFAWFFAFMAMLTLLVLSKKGGEFSRLWMGYAFLASLFLALLARVVLHLAITWFRKLGFNQKQILLIGNEKACGFIQTHLNNEAGLGFRVFSSLSTELGVLSGKPFELNQLEDLEHKLKQNQIVEVWLCLSLKDSEFLSDLLFALRHSTVNIRFVPDMSDYRLLNHRITTMAGIPTIDLSSSPLDGINGIFKRVEDVVLASSILIVISPLLILIALGVRFGSKGSVIFKQARHGADGRAINVYKFRTMFMHDDEGQVKQATKDDDRVTPFGAFLRRTSLDELPQFYNVLQGRMSVVGPRPHAIAHNEHYKELIESYMQRHKVKPGITGWAQVNGLRGETDTIEKMQKRVEYDLYYIDNWSLLFDIKIVFLTIIKVLSRENAY